MSMKACSCCEMKQLRHPFVLTQA